MIEILIITHGNFGSEIIKSAEIIIGSQEHVTALGLFHGDDIDQFRLNVVKIIKELDMGDGVLIFVDLFGGSPSNAVAISMNYKENTDYPIFECVTGINMPMLLEALTMRTSLNLSELKEHCINVGHYGIKDICSEFNFKR